MPKTRRDLLLAIADKVGGERARRMREAVRQAKYDPLLERPISDAEFASRLEQAEKDLPTALESFENLGPEDPGSWGFPN
jgi:hypothetical protein